MRADIHIIQEEKRQIVVEDVEGKIKPDTLYEIQNDTLFVYGGYRAFVSNSTIKSITGNKVFWMGVSKFEADYLKLNMTGGELYFGSGSDTTKIRLFEINASEHASLNFYKTEVTRANFTFFDTKDDFDIQCDSISVNLINSSLKCMSNYSEWIEIKKDKKSEVQFVN